MITQLIITSLFCAGWYNVFKFEVDGDGNIYGLIGAKIGLYAEANLPWYVYKPLMGCLNCMASFWGLIFYCYNYWNSFNVIELIIFIFALSALNGIYGKFID